MRAMSIPTLILIATPTAMGLARNMPIFIPMGTTMITIIHTAMIMPMATITIIMAWVPPMPMRPA